jgi:anti-sigma B factor antagonist
MLSVDIHRFETISVLCLKGSFDISQIMEFETVFGNLVKTAPETIAVNMRDVTYIDSSGIGCLIRSMNKVSSKGAAFYVVEPSTHLHNIFRTAGLTGHVDIISLDELRERFSIQGQI